MEPLAVGIGIEQGQVLMGSIGPAHRRAHTLCGETVSIALRIRNDTGVGNHNFDWEVASRHLGDFNLQSGCIYLPGLTTTHTLFAPEEQAEPLRITKGADRRPSNSELLEALITKIIHPIQCLGFFQAIVQLNGVTPDQWVSINLLSHSLHFYFLFLR